MFNIIEKILELYEDISDVIKNYFGDKEKGRKRIIILIIFIIIIASIDDLIILYKIGAIG